MAYMTSHGSVIRSGMLTTLSTDLSSIYRSVCPSPLSSPRLFIQGCRINEQLKHMRPPEKIE